jgi:hypothetical protein
MKDVVSREKSHLVSLTELNNFIRLNISNNMPDVMVASVLDLTPIISDILDDFFYGVMPREYKDVDTIEILSDLGIPTMKSMEIRHELQDLLKNYFQSNIGRDIFEVGTGYKMLSPDTVVITVPASKSTAVIREHATALANQQAEHGDDFRLYHPQVHQTLSPGPILENAMYEIKRELNYRAPNHGDHLHCTPMRQSIPFHIPITVPKAALVQASLPVSAKLTYIDLMADVVYFWNNYRDQCLGGTFETTLSGQIYEAYEEMIYEEDLDWGKLENAVLAIWRLMVPILDGMVAPMIQSIPNVDNLGVYDVTGSTVFISVELG